MYIQYSLYSPDDALIVRYLKFLFVFYCVTYTKYIPRKDNIEIFKYRNSKAAINFNRIKEIIRRYNESSLWDDVGSIMC